MARHLPSLALCIFSISIFISPALAREQDAFLIHGKTLGLKKEELSHFRVYWQDIFSSNPPSAVTVIQPRNNSSTGFGTMNMIDNPLTIGPELSSKTVGRAQGFYAFTAQSELAALMVMNFVITEGKYNGSTITLLGRNAIMDRVREMSVIGGSGLFRLARGYVHARTHKFDINTGESVEYNVYVLHY